MIYQHHSVSFTIEGVNGGFSNADGLLRIGDHAIILEFQTSDAIFGVIKSDLKSVKIPFSQLRKVGYIKKWFSAHIEIASMTMQSLRDVPGAKAGRVKLKIRKENREDAIQLNSTLQMLLSEYRLSESEERLSAISQGDSSRGSHSRSGANRSNFSSDASDDDSTDGYLKNQLK
jgi:hypothetical protein